MKGRLVFLRVVHTISRNEATFLRNTISSLRFGVHTFFISFFRKPAMTLSRSTVFHRSSRVLSRLEGQVSSFKAKMKVVFNAEFQFSIPVKSSLLSREKCICATVTTVQFEQITPTFLCIRISRKIPKSEFQRFRIPCILNLEFLCYRSKRELSIRFEVNSIMYRVSTFLDSICLALFETGTFDSTLEQKFLRTYNYSEKFPATKFSSS